MSRDGNAITCNEPDCEARATDAEGWYTLARGFMNHRCPTHAPPWRAFDIANRAHEKAREVEWDRARDAFELAWLEAYEAEHPAPKMPGSLR